MLGNDRNWRALDHCDDPGNDAEVPQKAEQDLLTEQISSEWIIVKDSEGVEVHTTDTQAAISIQLAIQAAIVVVISITIADSETADAVVQDLNQFIRTTQRNRQKTIIEGSKNISVTTTDTDIAVNIQALLQILIAIVIQLDIL